MTYVSNNFFASLESNSALNFYYVEIITFDGDSYTEEIEAASPEEAQAIAASMYDEVDYTMIQGVVAGW